MKQKKVISNESEFARKYRGPETGRVLTLLPGLNFCDADLVKEMQKEPRFARQLEDGVVAVRKSTALQDLVKEVEEGLSVAAIRHSRDAIAVAQAIESVPVLERMYAECRRVSVRTEIVRRLRKLGYEGE